MPKPTRPPPRPPDAAGWEAKGTAYKKKQDLGFIGMALVRFLKGQTVVAWFRARRRSWRRQ